MWSDADLLAPAVKASSAGKCYQLFDHPGDRLKQLLWGRWRQAPYFRDFWALKDVSFEVARGEVLGIVGRNGAGKSTLLQMVCGTLAASTGTLSVNGRVAALLELGAGFNPDFTGRENVYMNAAILGLTRSEVDARLDEILAFADIGPFIDQPVKTYSSGMFMRLAFAVATSVEPDILVIDEALSVGDGAFARKSFDRIMGLKEAGKTILFCSHSMYQVEALCSRALWIESGTLRLAGSAAEVTAAYQASLNALIPGVARGGVDLGAAATATATVAPAGSARVVRVLGRSGGVQGRTLELVSGVSTLEIEVDFVSDPALPAPSVAIGFADANFMTISSMFSVNAGVTLQRSTDGAGSVRVEIPRFALLKGRYTVTVILACEKGLHPYEQITECLTLNVRQTGTEQGLVMMEHRWLT